MNIFKKFEEYGGTNPKMFLLIVILISIMISVIIVGVLQYIFWEKDTEPSDSLEESNKVYLYTSRGPCQGSNAKCKTSIVYYAKGKFVNCSLTPSTPFPNNSISGEIFDVDYEIDKELFLEIADKSDFPIVCSNKRRDYFNNRNIYEGDYCSKDSVVNDFDSWDTNHFAYCCFDKYCTEWGEVYNVCSCDDSLNYEGDLTEVTCDTPEGEEYRC